MSPTKSVIEPPVLSDEQRKTGRPFKGFPDNLPRRYNACNEPCDMFVGPCICGAWHHGEWPPPIYQLRGPA